jgi:hypothetical protein
MLPCQEATRRISSPVAGFKGGPLPMSHRGRRAKSPEPEETEKPHQGAQFSHLEGKWRDCIRIHSGTAKLISAAIDRVFAQRNSKIEV